MGVWEAWLSGHDRDRDRDDDRWVPYITRPSCPACDAAMTGPDDAVAHYWTVHLRQPTTGP